MLEQDPRISLAELAAAGIRLRPVDAVTIVREVIAQVIRGEIPGVPSAHVIRLSAAGILTIEGPVVAGGRPVSRGAQLLDTLLPGFDAPPEYRAPGALRLVVARALGTLDLEPHPTLQSLSDALERFGAPDATPVLRALADSHREALDGKTQAASVQPAAFRAQLGPGIPAATAVAGDAFPADPDAITISDIRRARRATGLSLSEISSRTRIPVAMLRQLEWGYLRNWPAGRPGRTQLVRYARAAGLNEEMVLRVTAPLIANAGEGLMQLGEIELPLALDLPGPRELGEAGGAIDLRPRHRRVARLLGALAVPAAIAVGFVPGVWDEIERRLPDRELLRIADADPSPTLPDPPSPPPVVLDNPSPTPPPVVPADAAPASPAIPDARPATASNSLERTTLVEAPEYPGAFASAGGASFQDPGDTSGGDGQIVQAGTASGGAVLRITRIVNDSASNFHVRLSPDGGRIAFDSNRDGTRGVYLADSDGTNVRRVSGEGFAAVPSWSPDSRMLSYVRSEADRPRVWNIWTLDLETGEERRLTSHSTGQPWGASWFADGRRLAYSLGDRLVVLDVESGRQRSYVAPGRSRLVRTPAVSPDGRRIMFQVEGDGAWLLDLSDGRMRKVLSDPTAEDYIWSPDGRRVAYHSRQSGEWGVWHLMRQE